MSSSSSNDQQQRERQQQDYDSRENRARMKDQGRESRLSFRKFAEHRMRQDLKEEALEKCHPEVSKFAECAQEQGLLVIFKCNQFHKQVQECLAIHNSEQAWERYKLEHKDELEKRAKMGQPH